jgi:hypothetical protein
VVASTAETPLRAAKVAPNGREPEGKDLPLGSTESTACSVRDNSSAGSSRPTSLSSATAVSSSPRCLGEHEALRLALEVVGEEDRLEAEWRRSPFSERGNAWCCSRSLVRSC